MRTLILWVCLLSFISFLTVSSDPFDDGTTENRLLGEHNLRNGVCDVLPANRIDCGHKDISRHECVNVRGCCWNPVHESADNHGKSSLLDGFMPLPGLGDSLMDSIVTSSNRHTGAYSANGLPWCYHSRPAAPCSGYEAVEARKFQSGFTKIILEMTNKNCSKYSEPYPSLEMMVTFKGGSFSRVVIREPKGSPERYTIPSDVVPDGESHFDLPSDMNDSEGDLIKFDDSIAIDLGGDLLMTVFRRPFSFKIVRKSINEVIFDTTIPKNELSLVGHLVYENQYIELSTQLPKDANIYGLGERTGYFRVNTKFSNMGFWSRDHPTALDQNAYGSQPLYMDHRRTSDGHKTHGVFMRNSNGINVVLAAGSLTFKLIGGVIDIFFYEGPTPADVVKQHASLVGKPLMIPQWVLGFHQCRFGYHTLEEVKDVVADFEVNNIPLDTMWIDIDYMDGYRDFVFDPVNFNEKEVVEYFNFLHDTNRHSVLIVDPGIRIEPGLEAYDLGIKEDIFIKLKNGDYFMGKVWPGETYFPDFLNPKTQGYWDHLIGSFLNRSTVDGLWIDMNEVASFCHGDCRKEPSADDKLNFPPFAIPNGRTYSPLFIKTAPLDAVHERNGKKYSEYDTHNIYGLLEAQTTHRSMRKARPDVRPFLLSRSTFPGMGPYSAHWTGDNFSRWEDLHLSIPAILNYQIFGMPFVGADICGFIEDTTEELCARWMEVGSFYPFARNHNGLGHKSQEPYRWPSVTVISRKYLAIRYSLLSFWYTLFYEASEFGAPVVQPLFFKFPSDENTFGIDRQFLLGGSILVSPVLKSGANDVNAYFPKGIWYDYYSHSKSVIPAEGKRLTLTAPLDHMPLHILGGTSFTYQPPETTTLKTRINPFSLLIALDEDGSSSGSLYLDDGLTYSSLTSNATYVHFSSHFSDSEGVISGHGHFAYSGRDRLLGEVVVLGTNAQQKKFKNVRIQTSSASILEDGEAISNGIEKLELFSGSFISLTSSVEEMTFSDAEIEIRGEDLIIKNFSLSLSQVFRIYVW